MSPRYEVDPTEVSAILTVFEKGEVELLIGEPKSFEKKNEDGSVKNAGIRYPVVAAEGPEKGSKSIYTVYIHTPDAVGFGKQFVMAALGYPLTKDGEKAFNAKYKGNDWSVTPETNAVGDMWREPTGKRIIAVVDTQMGQDGVTQQQKWVKFRSIS